MNYEQERGDGGGLIHSFSYSGMSEVLAAASTENFVKERYRSSREAGKEYWTGTSSFESAVTLAETGWCEGRELVEVLALQVQELTGIKALEMQLSYENQGLYVDTGEFLTGNPECWAQPVEDEEKHTRMQGGKFVSMLLNMSVSAGISQDQILLRGAALATLTDVLEAYGFRVKIDCSSGVRSPRRGELLALRFPVKSFGEALNLDTLVFAAAHPAMFRRIVFGVLEQFPQNIVETFQFATNIGCYGYPEEDPLKGDYNFYFGEAMLEKFRTKNDVAEWIVEVGAAYGVRPA